MSSCKLIMIGLLLRLHAEHKRPDGVFNVTVYSLCQVKTFTMVIVIFLKQSY